MILKFLEEPKDNIIALFITDSLDNILETIKSRCQIINCFYDISSEVEENDVIEVNKILFEDDKYVSLLKIKDNYKSYERIDLIKLLKRLLDYYCKRELDTDTIEKIKLLNKAISLLNNNVNFDYVFDYIILNRR